MSLSGASDRSIGSDSEGRTDRYASVSPLFNRRNHGSSDDDDNDNNNDNNNDSRSHNDDSADDNRDSNAPSSFDTVVEGEQPLAGPDSDKPHTNLPRTSRNTANTSSFSNIMDQWNARDSRRENRTLPFIAKVGRQTSVGNPHPTENGSSTAAAGTSARNTRRLSAGAVQYPGKRTHNNNNNDSSSNNTTNNNNNSIANAQISPKPTPGVAGGNYSTTPGTTPVPRRGGSRSSTAISNRVRAAGIPPPGVDLEAQDIVTPPATPTVSQSLSNDTSDNNPATDSCPDANRKPHRKARPRDSPSQSTPRARSMSIKDRISMFSSQPTTPTTFVSPRHVRTKKSAPKREKSYIQEKKGANQAALQRKAILAKANQQLQQTNEPEQSEHPSSSTTESHVGETHLRTNDDDGHGDDHAVPAPPIQQSSLSPRPTRSASSSSYLSKRNSTADKDKNKNNNAKGKLVGGSLHRRSVHSASTARTTAKESAPHIGIANSFDSDDSGTAAAAYGFPPPSPGRINRNSRKSADSDHSVSANSLRDNDGTLKASRHTAGTHYDDYDVDINDASFHDAPLDSSPRSPSSMKQHRSSIKSTRNASLDKMKQDFFGSSSSGGSASQPKGLKKKASAQYKNNDLIPQDDLSPVPPKQKSALPNHGKSPKPATKKPSSDRRQTISLATSSHHSSGTQSLRGQSVHTPTGTGKIKVKPKRGSSVEDIASKFERRLDDEEEESGSTTPTLPSSKNKMRHSWKAPLSAPAGDVASKKLSKKIVRSKMDYTSSSHERKSKSKSSSGSSASALAIPGAPPLSVSSPRSTKPSKSKKDDKSSSKKSSSKNKEKNGSSTSKSKSSRSSSSDRKSTASRDGSKRSKKKGSSHSVAAEPDDDFSNFTPPKFFKEASDLKLIKKALRKNYVFDNLGEEDLETFMNAFEQFEVERDVKIMKQGDAGDYFYVVSKGKVAITVDGNDAGKVKSGDSFGDLALLYTSPREATAVAKSDTRLFRVDQMTFRFMLQRETEKLCNEKRKLLQGVSFLASVSKTDEDLLYRSMMPRVFEAGDVIMKKGEKESSFFIVKDGNVKCTDIDMGNTLYEDVTLGPGEWFGERAMISQDPRDANAIGITKGTVFSISHDVFEQVDGDLVAPIMKSQDKLKIAGIRILRDADLEHSDVSALAGLVTDKSYRTKERLFEEGDRTKAALYLVREGSVKLSGSDKNRSGTINAGGCFGHEQLLADANGECNPPDSTIVARYTATATATCSVGVLLLEDCRKIFDTKQIGDAIYKQESEVLDQRSNLRSSIQASTTLKDVEKEKIIGTGQFAEVWLCSVNASGVDSQKTKFALKVQAKEDGIRADAVSAIKREITVIQQMNHPNIIDLVNTYEDESDIYMLTSLVRGGELWNVIHREDENGEWHSGMDESQAKFYALNVADTLAYMHRQNFIFRDLKPENILIDTEGYPNIVDFGFAKHVTEDELTYTFCGTPNYLAPEIVMNRGHAAGADHWALGVLIYEMVAGENPFFYEGMDQMALFQAVVQEKFYPLPETKSAEVVDLVTKLLEKDPSKRLGKLRGGEKDILTHAWFADLDLPGLRRKTVPAPYVPPADKLNG